MGWKYLSDYWFCIWHYSSGTHSIGGWALFLVLNANVCHRFEVGCDRWASRINPSDHNRIRMLMLSALCRRPLDKRDYVRDI